VGASELPEPEQRCTGLLCTGERANAFPVVPNVKGVDGIVEREDGIGDSIVAAVVPGDACPSRKGESELLLGKVSLSDAEAADLTGSGNEFHDDGVTISDEVAHRALNSRRVSKRVFQIGVKPVFAASFEDASEDETDWFIG